MRFETRPGKQMQPNFTRRAAAAVSRCLRGWRPLGYSRASFVRLRRLEDALREAFDYFGGGPEQVLFDNTRREQRARTTAALPEVANSRVHGTTGEVSAGPSR
jgi:transposase